MSRKKVGTVDIYLVESGVYLVCHHRLGSKAVSSLTLFQIVISFAIGDRISLILPIFLRDFILVLKSD